MSPDPVVIVGAGLAGLRCAGLLADSGVEVAIYEASDGIGGRARTDTVDGFRLDRGFQVLLTDYPEARRAFDYERLGLGNFQPGAKVRMDGKFRSLSDPVRRPRSAFSTLVSPVGTAADKLRAAKMKREILRTDPAEILNRPDRTAISSLEDRGFSSGMIERFFRPFFGGVFIDGDLRTSSRMLEIFFRCFSSGSAALPAGGMNALADQLSERLVAGTIHLGAGVAQVKSDGIMLGDGTHMDASAVVVATDESAAADLLDGRPPVKNRVTSCVYFDAPESEVSGSWITLASAGEGPINELAVPSSVASGYAPEGRSLVSVSAIGAQAERPDLLEAVTRQLGDWFGRESVARWRHLGTKRVDYALPDFGPGRFEVGGLPPELESGMFICGDYRESPSIQGALVSGRKAAEAVLAARG
ncbi:MAG: FAD-dependent oxidoreductase [Cryobacterium sp.]|nr:FAD-dependent oxidoreductase [Cryobacterium sp.]